MSRIEVVEHTSPFIGGPETALEALEHAVSMSGLSEFADILQQPFKIDGVEVKAYVTENTALFQWVDVDTDCIRCMDVVRDGNQVSLIMQVRDFGSLINEGKVVYTLDRHGVGMLTQGFISTPGEIEYMDKGGVRIQSGLGYIMEFASSLELGNGVWEAEHVYRTMLAAINVEYIGVTSY